MPIGGTRSKNCTRTYTHICLIPLSASAGLEMSKRIRYFSTRPSTFVNFGRIRSAWRITFVTIWPRV